MKTISDSVVGAFILSCMKLQVECKKLSKEIDEMCRYTCAICGTRHDEVWTCENCGKRVCGDHIVREQNPASPYDDFEDVCINCLETRYDRN